MSNTLATIIIPVYNRAHTLPRLFPTLLAQTHRPLEIILVDNNSTDNSHALCLEFASKVMREDEEITAIVTQEQQRGAAAARNRGLCLASGAWVSFFDSDDEMEADFISAMLAAGEAQQPTDFVVARSRMVFKDGTERARSGLQQLSLSTHILSAALTTQSFVARTDFIRSIGGWNAAVPIWNDYELGIRMLQGSRRFATLDRTFHRIYQHDESITGASLGATFAQLKLAIPLIVQQVLLPKEGATTSSCRQALYYRLCILAGKLANEGHAEGAKWLEIQAQGVASSGKMPILATIGGSVLRHYTTMGGRGAWRAAIALLRNESSD